MERTFKNENGHLIADVKFDKDEISSANKKAINKLVGKVTVPGFRKGKAPLERAVAYLKNNDVYNEMVNALLRMLDKEIDTDEEFKKELPELANNFQPDVELTKFSDTEADFIITWVKQPVVTSLGQYADLEISATKASLEDSEIEEELKRLALDNAELVEQEKEAENGDTVNIDFEGLMDGKPFDGGSAKGFDLELGSHHFVPGFEEAVVSHKAGDKFDINLVMPENYPEPLTAKAVLFKVTLNSVKVKEIPEINDDFATTLSGEYVSKDLAELKEKVTKKLSDKKDQDYKNAIINEALLKCRNASTFVIAKEFIDRLAQSRMDYDRGQVEKQGLSLDEYLKLTNTDKEAYETSVKAGVESEIKTQCVYEEIAKSEKIAAPTREDIEAQLGMKIDDFATNYKSYLTSTGMSEEEATSNINGYLNQIFSTIMTSRVKACVLKLNSKEEVQEEKVEESEAEKPAEETKEAE